MRGLSGKTQKLYDKDYVINEDNMAKKTNDEEKLSFEDRLQRLQTIITQLENGSLPLEEGLALYKEGLIHAKASQALIENAKHEIKILEEESLKDFNIVE